jgi:hypothetical protein
MSTTAAILITLAIILPCLVIGVLSSSTAKIMVMSAVVGTSLWAAVDSFRLKVREYKSQVAAHPFVLFTACLGLWIVIFPVYLVVRSKIQAGLLPKEPTARRKYALYACIALWCLPVLLAVAELLLASALRLSM